MTRRLATGLLLAAPILAQDTSDQLATQFAECLRAFPEVESIVEGGKGAWKHPGRKDTNGESYLFTVNFKDKKSVDFQAFVFKVSEVATDLQLSERGFRYFLKCNLR